MHDKAICSPAEADDRIDTAIMGLLFESPHPVSVEEVERELDDHLAVIDGLARLHRIGLIHRLDGGFVFPTRAAVGASAMAD
jgi:hypothetical protein